MENRNFRLKELRKKAKLSGVAVAKKLGISPQYYYDIEKGERRLTTEIAAQLTDVLHSTVDYLIGAADINTYGQEVEIQKNSDPHEESELANIPIERLNQFKLTYKGHELSEDEANDIIELLEAALKRWKR